MYKKKFKLYKLKKYISNYTRIPGWAGQDESKRAKLVLVSHCRLFEVEKTYARQNGRDESNIVENFATLITMVKYIT